MPTMATRNVNHAPSSTTNQMGVLDPRRSGSPKRASTSHTCGMAASVVRAGSFQPNTLPSTAVPNHL